MSSEGTLAVAAATVALVQLLKWAKLPDAWGPLAVILFSGAGVGVWLLSGDSWPPGRTDIWPVVTGWINVTLSAAGTFGFTRAAASAVISASPPPGGGAGSSPTVKADDEPTSPTRQIIDASEFTPDQVDQIASRLLELRAEHADSAPNPADHIIGVLDKAERTGGTST